MKGKKEKKMNEEMKKFRNIRVKKRLQNGNVKKKKIEIEGRKRQEEIQIAERRRQEGTERRKLEYEERKRKEEIEFELQKIRLGAEGRVSNSVANQNVNSTQIKPKLELNHLMQKFNSDQSDISLYLIMFERLAKQAQILENTWVTHMLGPQCNVMDTHLGRANEITANWKLTR
ncbi:hypothetical protein AVEN_51058-1 [Araneus ventricosus]|uniref:Uncharacterized protein n=1 Tax=Araneus ventricosus TaxID=182803 RepID=A0A4Y2MYT3_ARAVE|nr:hypothetical protein AVEN_51058-1 [Araneus ventricosus]